MSFTYPQLYNQFNASLILCHWLSLFFIFAHQLELFQIGGVFFNHLLLFKKNIVVLGGDTFCHLQKFLQYIKYITLEFTPPSFFFILSSLHSWNNFNRGYFSIYIHLYPVFALYSSSFLYLLPPRTGAKSLGRTCSAFLISDFVKEKKIIFWFV
jgi:hypothetical protein